MTYRLKLDINTFNNSMMPFIILLSFFNNIGLFLFLIFIIIFGLQNSIQAIKSICLVTIRSALNPELAPSMSNFEYLKWIVLFSCAGILIKEYFNIRERKKINNILFPVILYLIYSSISSFISSTLPIVALMKIFSYGFVFIGILIGVYITINEFDWIGWIHKLLLPTIIISLVLYGLGLGFHPTNLSLFRGAINHPNILGTTTVLFIALNITILQLKKNKNHFIYHLLIIISLIIIWWSKARTSFIAAIVMLLVYLILLNKDLLRKALLIDIILVISVCIFLFVPDILNVFYDFLAKGNENILESATASRGNQIGDLLDNFYSSPMLGTGFAVPMLPHRSYTISTQYIVEPGNLFFAVLSYGGIMGFVLFSYYILNIIWSNRRNFKELIFLPLATILVSMGEMIFFSTNNMGPILYMFLAIYAFYGKGTESTEFETST
ncbi:O-antigen ligase family protein [Aerococcaceae bacterium DSM 111176]|nr:O-antigen ligase family protein [Aerococcaceae bacterium DSM 111176]